MRPPEPQDPEPREDSTPPEPAEPRLVGTFAAARSASERDTFNTLEVGPRWSFSS
ncbi:hypothetical protein [Nannocystis punicea]|uniref:Uncharacterized protein n=1 Tax=Nannocystis punicea TaxID=2995304 RepID=A0ABY7GVC7_9BACT|nr:hypothetical protein [Nannocystis poenicansa]WAS90907.1 hypothetical protein O0S08_32360 [Nannocystis poenicansa]